MFSQCMCDVLGCQVCGPTFSLFSAGGRGTALQTPELRVSPLLDGLALVLLACRPGHVALFVKPSEDKDMMDVFSSRFLFFCEVSEKSEIMGQLRMLGRLEKLKKLETQTRRNYGRYPARPKSVWELSFGRSA